jgi:hypothetical protein
MICDAGPARDLAAGGDRSPAGSAMRLVLAPRPAAAVVAAGEMEY